MIELARAGAELLSREVQRYLVVGIATFLLDIGLLVLFKEILGEPLWLATTVAFAAISVNFVLNRSWVFAAGPGLLIRVARYAALVLVNYGVTMAVVLGVTAIGAFYLLAKLLAVALCVVLNFFAYKHWVFA